MSFTTSRFLSRVLSDSQLLVRLTDTDTIASGKK